MRPPPQARSSWLRQLAGAVAVVVLVLLTQAVVPAEPAPIEPMSLTMSNPDMVAPVVAPPPGAEPFAPLPNPHPSRSVDAFETFVALVNGGDPSAVIELMVEELPAVLGTGTAQYPHLPTDASLWVDGVLDRAKVEGFVRYMSALPGSVDVSDCESVAGGFKATLVGCSYVASGGVLAPLGQGPERGPVYGVMIKHKVAGLIRPGDVHTDLWDRFAEWIALNHPDRSTVSHIESGWVLDPEYTHESALEQSALAVEMAVALADGQAELDAGAVRRDAPPGGAFGDEAS